MLVCFNVDQTEVPNLMHTSFVMLYFSVCFLYEEECFFFPSGTGGY